MLLSTPAGARDKTPLKIQGRTISPSAIEFNPVLCRGLTAVANSTLTDRDKKLKSLSFKPIKSIVIARCDASAESTLGVSSETSD
jgi:hypothetical protein